MNQDLAPPLGSRAEYLQDAETTITIDHKSGKEIRFGMNFSKRIDFGICVDPGTFFELLLNPGGNQLFVDLFVFVPGPNTHSDL